MENIAKLAKDIELLPLDGQKQVVDFVNYIKTRYNNKTLRNQRSFELSKDPFIGMWQDRNDMADSTEWVRKIRKSDNIKEPERL